VGGRLKERGRYIAHDGILTYQIIGRYDNTAEKHDGRGDSIVRPEDHIVDDGLVDQVSHLDEAGDRRHQAKHCHFCSICKREEGTPLSSSPAEIFSFVDDRLPRCSRCFTIVSKFIWSSIFYSVTNIYVSSLQRFDESSDCIPRIRAWRTACADRAIKGAISFIASLNISVFIVQVGNL